MPGKSQTHEDSVLNLMRGTSFTGLANVYVGLFTTNPANDASAGTEATGGGYARQACGFSAPSGTSPNRLIANAAEILITMPAVTVTGVGIWSLVTGGTLLYWVAITSKVFDAGDQARFAAAALTVTED